MTILSTEQRIATNPEISCWVEASAGTGKTKVLTDRVLALLLTGVNPEKILCLTFTKAAAAEMWGRVREKISLWSGCGIGYLKRDLANVLGKNPTQQHIKVARQLFFHTLKTDGLKIQTVHAFSQFLLKSFPLEAGLMPHFQIMSEHQIHACKKDALEKAVGNLSEQHLHTITQYFSLSRLEDIFFNDSDAGFLKSLQQKSWDKISDYLKKCLCLSDVVEEEKLKKSFLEMQGPFLLPTGEEDDTLSVLRKSVEEKIAAWDAYVHIFLTKAGTIQKRILSAKLQRKYPTLSIDLESHALQLYEFVRHLDKHIVYNLTESMFALGMAYNMYYTQHKEEQAWIDYDDLIEKAITLLKNAQTKPWIIYKLEGGIEHILVDEAQDTSELQWMLVQNLVEEFFAVEGAGTHHRTLFVVGDSKQSIYSFQGADPKIFQSMKEYFSALVKGSGRPWHVVHLSTSYRSTEAVLKFVDHVFENNMALKKNITSKNYISHQLHRSGQGGRVELWPLAEGEEEEVVYDRWAAPSQTRIPETSAQKLATSIAETIATWLNTKKMLLSQNKCVEPKDIMVLVRKRDIFLHELVRALKHRRIPVSGMDRIVLNEELCVQDLMAVGSFCLLPDDDLNLACVLKGPFFNWTEEALFDLCHTREKRTLWEIICQRKEEFPETYQNLTLLTQYALSDSPVAFYGYILNAWEGRKKIIHRLGAETEDVVEEFLSVCFQFESEHDVSLQKFHLWIEEHELKIKRNLQQSDQNHVRLMTVHGSKGLQAPIVFLPDTTQPPMERPCFVSTNDQINPVYLCAPKKNLRDSVCNIVKEEDDTEYYRLLYVAMTRAEDELYICGQKPKRGVSDKSWYALLEKSIQSFGNAFPFSEKEQGWFYETPHLLPFVGRKIDTDNNKHPELKLLPEWVYAPYANPVPLEEKQEKNKSLLSSRQAKERGVIIHKILQWIPFDVADDVLHDLLEQYLNKISKTDQDKNCIRKTITRILSNPQWKAYVKPNTHKHIFLEAPIHGVIQGKPFIGMIDVLVIDRAQEMVAILDYKTGYVPVEVPEQYKKQLETYASILRNIYPTYVIKKIICWTQTGELYQL